MRKTKKLALTLSVLGTAVAALAAANLDLTTASAATVDQGSGIFMNYGASVRCNVEDLKNSGIRYELRLTTAEYDALKTNDEATFGVLIAPASYEDTAVLNEASVFGVGGTQVYNWATWSEEEGGYVYEAQENKTRIVNVSTTVDFETTNLKKKTVEGVEYYYYYGSMTGILSQNLAREFVGVGYVSTSETDYTFATRNDNVRSIAYVAQQSILKDTTTLGETEEEQAKAKTWLQENYVDEVADVETTYTVEYYVPTNLANGDSKALIKTEEVKTTIDEKIEYTPEMEGYVITAAANNDVKAMANGKTTIEMDCAYADKINVKLQGNSTQYYVFEKHAFYYLTENSNTTLGSGTNGIFYNGTNAARTITVGGSSGAAAILDKNGLVIEGRDGANGKVVNAENTVRSTSTKTVAQNAFAANMTIPVGGFAIVVHNSTSSTNVSYGVSTETTNFRDFMYKSIISNYGNCVQIAVNGTDFAFTDYQPMLKAAASSNAITYLGTTEEAAKAAAVADLTVKSYDTFDSAGTVLNNYTAEVTSTGGYSSAATGEFVFTIVVTDGNGTTATLTRTVEVRDKEMTITIGANSTTVDEATKFIVLGATKISTWTDAFYLVTPEFKAKNATFATTDSHGEAIVLNQYGEIVRVYDGANGKYFDATIPNGATNSGCTAAGYLNEAYGSLQTGEYLLIAPNTSTNNTRKFLLDNRTIGAQVSLIGVDKTVTFATKA